MSNREKKMFPLDLIVHIAISVCANACAFIKATICGDDDINQTMRRKNYTWKTIVLARRDDSIFNEKKRKKEKLRRSSMRILWSESSISISFRDAGHEICPDSSHHFQEFSMSFHSVNRFIFRSIPSFCGVRNEYIVSEIETRRRYVSPASIKWENIENKKKKEKHFNVNDETEWCTYSVEWSVHIFTPIGDSIRSNIE